MPTPRTRRKPRKAPGVGEPIDEYAFFMLEGRFLAGEVTEAEMVATYRASLPFWQENPQSNANFYQRSAKEWSSGKRVPEYSEDGDPAPVVEQFEVLPPPGPDEPTN